MAMDVEKIGAALRDCAPDIAWTVAHNQFFSRGGVAVFDVIGRVGAGEGHAYMVDPYATNPRYDLLDDAARRVARFIRQQLADQMAIAGVEV